MSEEDVEQYIWTPHHTWAGEELYGICVGLRGFYMKVGDADRIQPTRTLLALLYKGAKDVLCGIQCLLAICMAYPPGDPL